MYYSKVTYIFLIQSCLSAILAATLLQYSLLYYLNCVEEKKLNHNLNVNYCAEIVAFHVISEFNSSYHNTTYIVIHLKYMCSNPFHIPHCYVFVLKPHSWLIQMYSSLSINLFSQRTKSTSFYVCLSQLYRFFSCMPTGI